MAVSSCSIMASAFWSRRRTDEALRARTSNGELVGLDARLGQRHPDDGGDQHEIGARQCDIGKPAKAAIRQEDPREHKAGDDVQHNHGPDQDHLDGKPLLKRGLKEDQRRAAADGDEGGGRGHPDVDETCHPMQTVQIRPRDDRPALPEQEGEGNQPAGPDRDRCEMDEFRRIVTEPARRAEGSTRLSRAPCRDRAGSPAPTSGARQAAGRRAERAPRATCWRDAPHRAAVTRTR